MHRGVLPHLTRPRLVMDWIGVLIWMHILWVKSINTIISSPYLVIKYALYLGGYYKGHDISVHRTRDGQLRLLEYEHTESITKTNVEQVWLRAVAVVLVRASIER
jgi:hypothetical protein